MSITDELRTEARGFGDYIYTSEKAHRLLAIADRIDVEHESACAEAYGNGVMSVPTALDESQWMRLPNDADGKPVHIDDIMEWPDGRTFDVVGIGDGVLFYVEDGNEQADWTGASTKHHHHAPTVEDVLREFALKVAGEECMTMRTGVVEEYAKRLKLAESEDA